ncbi:MAG: cupin domain-containing protein [Bacteroidales bacterium]|nr:cupin domain-containing protein [Bacteroidales bacterium]
MKKNTCTMLYSLFIALLFIAMGCSSNNEEQEEPSQNVMMEHEDLGTEPWVVNIEELTVANNDFRAARWTGGHLQLTVMSLKPGEEIGLESHPHNDQFLRIETGKARVLMGQTEDSLYFDKEVSDDWSILIPAGYWHNLINTGDTDVKIYSLYAPPEHPKGTIHHRPEDDDHHRH